MSIIKKILHPFIILIIVGILNLILGVVPQIIDDEQEVEEVLLLMTLIPWGMALFSNGTTRAKMLLVLTVSIIIILIAGIFFAESDGDGSWTWMIPPIIVCSIALISGILHIREEKI